MKFKKNLFVILLLFLGNTLFGQLRDTIYQTFKIDETQSISLDIIGDYEIVKWKKKSLKSEIQVKIYEATPSIFNYFLKKGRYDLEGNASGESFSLVTKNKVRKPIFFKGLDCDEYTNVIIYVPDDFVEVSKTLLTRQMED